MSDITPIRLAAYEHLAVRTIDTVVSTVEPGALVECPDDWHVLAFSASGREGEGLVLLGKSKKSRYARSRPALPY